MFLNVYWIFIKSEIHLKKLVAAVCNLEEIYVFHIVFQFPIGRNTFDIRFDSAVDTNMGVLKYFTVVPIEKIKQNKNMLPRGMDFSSN